MNLDLPTPGGQQPTQLNIDMSTTPNLVCDKCGGFAFQPIVTFKVLSPLISPSGKEGVLPAETFMCIQCGYIPPKLNPFPIVIPDVGSDVVPDEAPPSGVEL